MIEFGANPQSTAGTSKTLGEKPTELTPLSAHRHLINVKILREALFMPYASYPSLGVTEMRLTECSSNRTGMSSSYGCQLLCGGWTEVTLLPVTSSYR